MRLHQSAIACQTKLAIDDAGDSLTGYLVKVIYRQICECFIFCFGYDCLCQRMLGQLLQRCGNLQEFLFPDALAAQNIRDHRCTLGDGAGLIQNHSIDAMRVFQRLCGFDENAIGSTLASADHNSGGRCQPKRAGAGDNKDGNANGKGKLQTIAGNQPGNGGNKCDSDDDGNKDAADLIRQLCNGRFGAGGLIHQANDLCQSGVVTNFCGLHLDVAGFVDGSTDDFVSGVLFHRDALAGQGGFIDGREPLQHNAVHRDGLTGFYDDDISKLHILNGYLKFLTITLHGGGFGRQIHQLGNGVRGLALCAGLQSFAQCDERQDHAGRLEVQVHHKGVHQFHIAVAHADADFVNGINAIDRGSPGPNGDQRIHVGRAVEQGAKAHLEVFAVDRQHREQQEELGEGEGHGVLHAQQPSGQGPVHHVSHGDIAEGGVNRAERTSRCFIALYSACAVLTSGVVSLPLRAAAFGIAPYPAFSTAATMEAVSKVPSS